MQTKKYILIFGLAFTSILLMMILFLAAGTFAWWEGWVYITHAIAILLTSRLLLLKHQPALVEERGSAINRSDVHPVDKVLMPLIGIILPVVSWIAAGLDKRFHWSPDLAFGWQMLALVLMTIGSGIGVWAMLVNPYFSSHIRIQSDRDHSTVDAGPYRFVRHPGYAGGLLSWIAAPFFWSSYWVVIPCIIAIAVTILRTKIEDQLLHQELPGYVEYGEKVRFRLIPKLW